jgi:hypothetical protein
VAVLDCDASGVEEVIMRLRAAASSRNAPLVIAKAVTARKVEPALVQHAQQFEIFLVDLLAQPFGSLNLTFERMRIRHFVLLISL